MGRLRWSHETPNNPNAPRSAGREAAMRLPLGDLADWGRIPRPAEAVPTKIPSTTKAVPLHSSPPTSRGHDHPKGDNGGGHRSPRRIKTAPPFKSGPILASAQQHADWFARR